MFTWSLTAQKRPDGYAAVELHARHSASAVNAAVQAFFLQRDELASACNRLGPMLEEEL